jgi:surfactin synthase thioesterase subunit
MTTGVVATALRVNARGVRRRRLFCLPYAGGGAGVFRAWSEALPADVELLAAQLPGREGRLRERPFDSVADIVNAVLPLIAAASDLPYALFGHSMGALVAFELALLLEASPLRAPSHLFVSARRAPDEPESEPPVHHLPDTEFVDELQRRYRAIPEAVRREPDLLALLLPTLRADLRAIERYPVGGGRRLRAPLTVYGGSEDRHPTPSQLPGWQRVAEKTVRVRVFSGDHFYLTAQRDALVSDIARVWADAAVAVEEM